MTRIPNNCVEFNDKRKKCVASENGKTYQLNNSSEFDVRKVKIDKCIAQQTGEKRCDYLMNIDSIQRAVFIELKGGALNVAVKQIISTINFLKVEFVDYQLEARIIGSRDVPNIKNTVDYIKLARLVKPNGGIKIATNKILIENI